MRCIVVDDEKIMLEELCLLLMQAGTDVIGAYQDSRAALTGIREWQPDAVFLDVEMPGLNGIELAKRIAAEDAGVQIVFVTAHEQYAVKAFELSAIYYVLKPITAEKIEKAVQRVRQVMQMSRRIGKAEAPALIGAGTETADRLSVKVREDIVILQIADIVFLKSDNGKTTLVTKSGSYESRSGLHFWEEKLKNAAFLRCHRGYLVNTAYIRKMVHVLGEYRELVLAYGDMNIPVSRQKVAAVKQWMGIV